MWGQVAFLLFIVSMSPAMAADLADARSRMEADFAAGKPLVAHVVVALADNQHQGIVPVPAALGDGTKPSANLYWGALYGVRTHFKRSKEWSTLPIAASSDARVLDRVMFRRQLRRGGRTGEAILVAEAWRGDRIAEAIGYFLEMNRGQHAQALRAGDRDIEAGGAAHVMVFVGHNGLMDFDPPQLTAITRRAQAHADIVLACISDDYFSPLLKEHGAPLLMTTGLMAPEAYTLEAALSSWFSGEPAPAVRSAAAQAYARYQGISERAASRLFRTPAGVAP